MLFLFAVLSETSLTLKGIAPTHEFALDEGYTYHYAEAIEQQPLNSIQVNPLGPPYFQSGNNRCVNYSFIWQGSNATCEVVQQKPMTMS